MQKPLKPFITYYGGKWRSAKKYPPPDYDLIIEPFAGSAGYSLHYHWKDVVLFEKYDALVAMWNWLIGADYNDVMRLPIIGDFDHIDQVDAPYGAKVLIGFGLNSGMSSPCNMPSKWARLKRNDGAFWIKEKRQRVARQVEHIKHWKCYQIDRLGQIPDYTATWFIDPPYQKAGIHYKHNSKNLDFSQLATWVLMRQGQAIVCENAGADWFRFDNQFDFKSTVHPNRNPITQEVWSHLRDGMFV